MARVGAISYAEPIAEQVFVITSGCIVCGKKHELVINREGYENWQYGMEIQKALPQLSTADRELLISGTCDECFNEMFPPED